MHIRKKLMLVTMSVSGLVILLTCAAFFISEVYTFRQATVQKLTVLGKVIAANSTAALAFDRPGNATEILSALKAEPHIVAACIYDEKGKIFAEYTSAGNAGTFPAKPLGSGYTFTTSYLESFLPVIRDKQRLGTLYLRSDLGAIYERLSLYGLIVVIVMLVAGLITYVLSAIFQRSISKPVLALSETARMVTEQRNYSVRATRVSHDEIGVLTDAFNDMLGEIEKQTKTLNEFNHNLEKKVAERTAELEAANRELESFSYSISHDLRAPVRAINGYINIFAEEYAPQFDEEGRRLIGIVMNNSKKMGLLIDDLLTFSKLGRKELAKTHVPMKELVHEVWEGLMRSEQGRQVEFVLGELADTRAERSTMRQVWVNLLSNALKYSGKKDKARIVVSSEIKNDAVIYAVSDNGTGFNMQYYDKLFGVFQRLHAQEEFEGTGVGLAIVHRIIEKHGGKIWAKAREGAGATFYFSLPAESSNRVI